MLCITLLITVSSFINKLVTCPYPSVIFQVLHFPPFDLFRSVIFRWCKCRAPSDDRCRPNVYSCRGLLHLKSQLNASIFEALKVSHHTSSVTQQQWQTLRATVATVSKLYGIHSLNTAAFSSDRGVARNLLWGV